MYVASTLALVSLCWSGGDNHVASESGLGIGSSDDENVSGSTVDTEPLFQSLQKIAHGDRHLVLVSTMDGYLTAINAATGVEEWSVSTGITLVSSSISKFEVNSGGRKKRLVPSLDGSLYQVDSDGIELVSLTADFLLSSSFKFSEDLSVVGGKEVATYGIDLNTGKVRYVCSAAGCKYFDVDSKSFASGLQVDEVLVLTRTTNTVRAVEIQSGIEKWNFSVGQHDVSFVSRKPARYDSAPHSPYHDKIAAHSSHGVDASCTKSTTSGDVKRRDIQDADEENESSDQCEVQTVVDEYEDVGEREETLWSQPPCKDIDIDLKVVVPTGYIFAVDRLNPSHVLWQQKFKAAIANVWDFHNQRVTEVSLFSSHIVPDFMLRREAANDEELAQESSLPNAEPLLYIGMYEDQLYIQPSVQMMMEVGAAATDAVQQGRVDMPRVRWNPYIITALSRTPAASPPRYPQIGSDDWSTSTAVIPWHEQYPFDGGYYLFPECPAPVKLLTLNTTDQEDEDITVSLLNWWKEVVGISAVTSLFVNLLIFRCKRSFGRRFLSQTGDVCKASTTSEPVVTETDVEHSKSNESNADSSKTAEFTSRYLTDFHQEACLGHGGFGVVFRARNQLDDCVYAVKRIALNDSEQARQKVTREVKALAKLDHSGIVRYYQSWFECPPPGWQEERDKVSIDLSLATPTAGVSPTDGTSSVKPPAYPAAVSVSVEDKLQQCLPLRFPDSFPVCDSASDTKDLTSSLSESGSSSCQDAHEVYPPMHAGAGSSSFEISFRDEGRDVSDCSKKPVDCGSGNGLHAESSFSVVFEGSASNGPDLKCVPKTETLPDMAPKPADRPHTLDVKCTDSDDCRKSVPEAKSKVCRRKLYLYIQMQLCQPESLKDWLNDNTLNRDKYQLLNMFHQIVSAIAYVHQCGLMHRDLKPSNIFFAMDGSIKIGDFGLVTAIEENCCDGCYAQSPLPEDRRHTDQVGTKLYMSPEQSAGRSYTHKVDVYALGMIFFELFYPFTTEMERISTLLNVRKLEFPSRFTRELPEEANFVRPLLSHDPDSRPSADDVLQDPLVIDFEETSRAYRRLRTHSRDRSLSSSSGNSAGGDGPSSSRTVESVL